MKNQFLLFKSAVLLCFLVLTACNENSNELVVVIPKDSIEVQIKDSIIQPKTTTKTDSIIELAESKRPRVTLVPCSNGYFYMSQGVCVNDELEELLAKSNLNYLPFPLAKMSGAGFSGIYSFKDSKRIRDKIDFDVLILTRMYGYEYGVETLGYTIKLIDVNGEEEVLSIGNKVVGESYEDIVKHLNKNFEKLEEDISSI